MIINGIDEVEFERGWWGENDDGKKILGVLDLPATTIPFDIRSYLTHGKADIRIRGRDMHLTLKKYDEWFEFGMTRKTKPKILKLYREWNGEDLNMIMRLESYAVGEYTRLILRNRDYKN